MELKREFITVQDLIDNLMEYREAYGDKALLTIGRSSWDTFTFVEDSNFPNRVMFEIPCYKNIARKKSE